MDDWELVAWRHGMVVHVWIRNMDPQRPQGPYLVRTDPPTEERRVERGAVGLSATVLSLVDHPDEPIRAVTVTLVDAAGGQIDSRSVEVA